MPTRKSKKGGAVPRNRRRNKQNKNGNKGAIVVPRRVQPTLHVRLSPCARKYAMSLGNPFGGVSGVCIPDTIALPSVKTKYMSRGTFRTNAAGFGWVAFNPWLMIQNTTLISGNGTDAPVACSDTTFVGTAITLPLNNLVPPVGQAQFHSANSPYGPGDFQIGPIGNNMQYRLVSAGLRVKYVGTTLTQGGRLLMYRNRNNAPVIGALDISIALIDSYYSTTTVSRNWHVCNYFPSRTQDLSYVYLDQPSVAPQNLDYRVMFALVEGLPSNSLEFEAVAYFEVVGVRTGQPTSPSHSDPVGMGAVVSSAPNKAIQDSDGLTKYLVNGAAKAVLHAASSVVGSMIGDPTSSGVARAALPPVSEVLSIEDIKEQFHDEM